MPYTIVVVATASDSATNQYLAPFAGVRDGRVVHGQRHGRVDHL